MLVPKRETIRSKQLSLPGDKQTAFTGFICLGGVKNAEKASGPKSNYEKQIFLDYSISKHMEGEIKFGKNKKKLQIKGFGFGH